MITIASSLEPQLCLTNADGQESFFTWDLVQVTPDNFQVRIILFNGEVVWTKNLHLTWVAHGLYDFWRDTNFVVDGYEYTATMWLPSWQEIHFMLRVYVLSEAELCEECGIVTTFCEENHIFCRGHDDFAPERAAVCQTFYVNDRGDTEEFYICYACEGDGVEFADAFDYLICNDCDEYAIENSDYIHYREIYDQVSAVAVCIHCLAEYYFWCAGCDKYVADGDVCYSEDYDEYRCPDCYEEGDPGLYEWNYRPALVFHPEVPKNPLKPLYIGLELEFSWSGPDARDWIERTHDKYEDLLYCKSDSSVSNGFEVVTHPMSPEWALENFPFKHFQEAIDEGAYPKHESCGTHIHIDKAALTTAQMWKMLQVHMKLPDICGRIGGRGTNASYAKFDHGSNEKIIGNMFKIAREKGKAFGDAQRYVAVNVQNEQTIELRYMEGSINPNDIRKNIQWVQALYDFTDTISAQDVRDGILKQEGYLLDFLLKGDYPEVVSFLQDKMTLPLAMPVRSV